MLFPSSTGELNRDTMDIVTDIIVILVCLNICLVNEYVFDNKYDAQSIWIIIAVIAAYLLFIYV